MGRLTVEVAARADARTGEFVEAFARRVEAMPPASVRWGWCWDSCKRAPRRPAASARRAPRACQKIEALLGDVAGLPRHGGDGG